MHLRCWVRDLGWEFGWVSAGGGTYLFAAVRIWRPPGAKLFAFYVFTRLVYHPTAGPFGDPLSGLPERGERATASSQTAHPSFPAEAEKLSRSVVPNGNPLGGLLLPPPNPLRWALAGTPAATPFHPPGVNVDMICRICASRVPPQGDFLRGAHWCPARILTRGGAAKQIPLGCAPLIPTPSCLLRCG